MFAWPRWAQGTLQFRRRLFPDRLFQRTGQECQPHKLRLAPSLRNERMLRLLQQILNGQNQFASGGLLLMIIGGIVVFLRQPPLCCWSWIVEQERFPWLSP